PFGMIAAPSSLVCDMVARGCEPAQKKGIGCPMPFFVRKDGARARRARRSPGVENGVELQRIHVVARDELEAQLQVLIDDVSRPYAEQQAIVVAEIQAGAADQLHVGRHQVPGDARRPQAAGAGIAKGPAASGPLEFSGIHVPGFRVDVEVSRYCREIVAAEDLEARSVVEVRNAVLAQTAAEEQSPVVEPLGRGDGRESCRDECNRYEARYF